MYFVNYNTEWFCGMFLEPYNKEKCIILLFRTGSYTFLGVKSMGEIQDNIKFKAELINLFTLWINMFR